MIEPGHLDRELDRCTGPVKRERTVVCLRYWDDPAINFRREWLVDTDLGLASQPAALQGRIVEKRNPDGSLDLQGTIAVQKHRSRMRIDTFDLGKAHGIFKEREHGLLVCRLGRCITHESPRDQASAASTILQYGRPVKIHVETRWPKLLLFIEDIGCALTFLKFAEPGHGKACPGGVVARQRVEADLKRRWNMLVEDMFLPLPCGPYL
jgi:hypothetical protein